MWELQDLAMLLMTDYEYNNSYMPLHKKHLLRCFMTFHWYSLLEILPRPVSIILSECICTWVVLNCVRRLLLTLLSSGSWWGHQFFSLFHRTLWSNNISTSFIVKYHSSLLFTLFSFSTIIRSSNLFNLQTKRQQNSIQCVTLLSTILIPTTGFTLVPFHTLDTPQQSAVCCD